MRPGTSWGPVRVESRVRVRVDVRSGHGSGPRRRWSRLVPWCASGALLLGGCTFDETTPPLGLATPDRFTFAGKGPAPPVPTDWPRLFGSPELTRLAASAAAGNLDVAAAAARIVQAQGQAEIASSAQLPQLSGSGSAQRSFNNVASTGVVTTGGVGSTVVSSNGTTAIGGGTAGSGTAAGSGTGLVSSGSLSSTGSSAATSAAGSTAGSTLVSSGGAGTTTGAVVSTGGGNAASVFRLGLTASYEVDLWGRNAFNSAAAEHGVLVNQFSRDAILLSSVASVVNQYFLLLSAQDRIRIARNNAGAARDVLDAIKGRLTVGTVTQLEVAQQQSILDQQLATIPPFELQADQARTQIALLTGRTPEGVRVAGGSLDRLRAPVIPPGLPAQLLRRRPDVAQAGEALASAAASVQAARADFFPSLSLTGTGGLESTALRNLLSPDALVGTLAADVMQPIFDGYALQGQLDQARGVRREDLELFRKAVIQALVDVENALTAIRRDLEHERLLADVVRSSQQAYDIERERLKVGTIDITTVLQTQLTLFGAQDALAFARLTRFQAIASLAQALGGGWTDPRRAPVEPAIALPAPFTYGLPGRAIVPPNEAVTETHALPGQPPVPNAGTLEAPGLGLTGAVPH